MNDELQEIMEFPIRVDPHDEAILAKLKKILYYEDLLANFDEYLWDVEHLSEQDDDLYLPVETDLDDEGWQESMFDDLYGAWYKTNKEGNVILVWYALGMHINYPIPILRKIPYDLLELSHLKYFCLFCDVNAIETIPSTLKSNDVFEVLVEPLGPLSTPLTPYRTMAYHICQEYNIYEDRPYLRDEKKKTGYEIIIVRKDLIKEIYHQSSDDYLGTAFLKNEMFKRFWKSDQIY